MRVQVSPQVVIAIIVLTLLVVGIVYWKTGTGQVRLPSKPPSGPIELPPSQQGRPLPMSGAPTSAPLLGR
jgi:hypothetical protein